MKKIKKLIFSQDVLLVIIFSIAFLSRFLFLNTLPDGALPDEAYGAYNAYSLMTEGIDSRGYSFPVYFIAWGSGMSVLYSYLAIPFFKLFGVCLWAYRLPQAIVSVCSVIAIYVITKELFSKQMGMFLAFILAINPWSILNGRFGLDANMAPGMFIIGLCFFVLAIRKSTKYMIPAALFFGLTLYCYALSWIMIPIFLVLCLVFYLKEIPFNKYTWISVGLLFLLALPLLLFLAINLGFMPEISTSFISIPKLASFRGDEMNLANIISSLKDTIKTILYQFDGATHTSSKLVGAYYYINTPFFIFGILHHFIFIIRHFKFGKTPLETLWFLWLASAAVICVLNANITIIHINLIHIPIIFYSGYGIRKLADLLQTPAIVPACVAFFLCSFVIFSHDYYTQENSYFFGTRTDEVIELAKDIVPDGKTIYIYEVSTIKYSNLLWHELPSAHDYYQNAVYAPGHPAWQELEYYNGFGYITDISQATEEGVYIILSQYEERFQQLGYTITSVNSQYSIAQK